MFSGIHLVYTHRSLLLYTHNLTQPNQTQRAGKYPVEAVQTVASICRAAEGVFDHSSHYTSLIDAAWEAVSQATATINMGGDSDADDQSDDINADKTSLSVQMVGKGWLGTRAMDADDTLLPIQTVDVAVGCGSVKTLMRHPWW